MSTSNLKAMNRRALLKVTALLALIPFTGGAKPFIPRPFELTPEEKIRFISSIRSRSGKEAGFEKNSLMGEVEINRSQGNFIVSIQFPEELNDTQHMIRAVELYAELKCNQSIPMSLCMVHAYDPRVRAIFQYRTPQWRELSRMYDRRPSVY